MIKFRDHSNAQQPMGFCHIYDCKQSSEHGIHLDGSHPCHPAPGFFLCGDHFRELLGLFVAKASEFLPNLTTKKGN